MSEDIVLKTIVHISDLHIGDKLDGQLSADVPRMLARFPDLEGFLGHHYDALTDLADFFEYRRQQDPNCRLIVSGDLTVNGAPVQFDLADGFLGTGCSSSAFGLGLHCTDWAQWSIAGNHDHWPGTNRIFGGPTPALTNYFKAPFPKISDPPELLSNGASIRYIFLNTEADVGRFSLSRLLARGKFVSQLTALKQLLPKPLPREVRVLVLHHSLTPGDPNAPLKPATQRPSLSTRMVIDAGTQSVLRARLVECGIQILLCGHLHTPRLSLTTASNGREELRVLEARCGTTTQKDEYPDDVLKKITPQRRLAPNTLMVHQLLRRGGDMIWRSQIYWRSSVSQTFTNRPNTVSSHLPTRLTEELKVYPR